MITDDRQTSDHYIPETGAPFPSRWDYVYAIVDEIHTLTQPTYAEGAASASRIQRALLTATETVGAVATDASNPHSQTCLARLLRMRRYAQGADR